jgi:hypothetical protein
VEEFRTEPAFFVGAFRAVDLEVARRADARFLEDFVDDDFFAEARFADLDVGGLAWLSRAEMLSRSAADCCSTSARAARSPARPRSAATTTFRARFLRNPALRRSCSIFFLPISVPFSITFPPASVTSRG